MFHNRLFRLCFITLLWKGMWLGGGQNFRPDFPHEGKVTGGWNVACSLVRTWPTKRSPPHLSGTKDRLTLLWYASLQKHKCASLVDFNDWSPNSDWVPHTQNNGPLAINRYQILLRRNGRYSWLNDVFEGLSKIHTELKMGLRLPNETHTGHWVLLLLFEKNYVF